MHKSAYNKDNWLYPQKHAFESMLKKFYLLEGSQFQFFDLLPSQLKEARRDVTEYPVFIGPESDHCLLLSLTDSITDFCFKQ